MRSRFISYLRLLALSLAIVFFASGCAAKSPPKAVGGLLDLSGWNPQAVGMVRLNGSWDFYWDRLLTPGDFQRGTPPKTGEIRVPGSWKGYPAGGKHLPASGYATFRLRLKLKPGHYAIYIYYMETAYRMWVDGRLVAANGKVGTSPGTTTSQFAPGTASFLSHGGTDQVVVQVASFNYMRGGMPFSLLMGTDGQMAMYVERRLAFFAAIFGGILIMGIYYLFAYTLRRDVSLLYFGMFSLFMAARLATSDQLLVGQLFPSSPWEATVKLGYVLTYAVFWLLTYFLRCLYPAEYSLWIARLSLGLAAMGWLTVLFEPLSFSSGLFEPDFQLILLAYSLYGMWVLAVAVRRRREGAGLFLGGFLFFFAMMLNDILSVDLILPTYRMVSLGAVVLIFALALLLSRRFAREQAELQTSRRMLTEQDESLRKNIAEMLHGRVQTRLLLAGHRLSQAENLWRENPEEALALVAAAGQEIQVVREEDVRQVSRLLHPSIIKVGLVPAIGSLAASFEGHFTVSLEVDRHLRELDEALEGGIPETVRLAAYRVLEEALNNVSAHAVASAVKIYAGLASKRRLFIMVKDNGRGVDLGKLQTGLGLRSVAARVDEMGGEWRIFGRIGGGTTLTAWIPLRQPGRGNLAVG